VGGALALVLGSGLVAASAALFATCLRLRSTVSFLLATYLLASAEIVALSLLLSTGRWLDRGASLVAFLCVFAVAVVVWRLSDGPSPASPADSAEAVRSVVRDRVVGSFTALAVLTHAYLLASALTVPQGVEDALLYHLPRAALWKQQHAVAYVPDAPDERINAFSPNAEIETMASMILSDGDRFVTVAQLLAVLFACLAIVGVARQLGLSLRAGVFGALAFSTFTVVALQTPTALNDLVVGSLLVICAYFALGTSRTELALAALALALALGTKLTALFALPALALFVLSSQPRRRWPAIAVFGAAGLVAGFLWLGVNLAHTGRLDAGVGVDRGGSAAERVRLSFLDLLELSDAEGKGLLLSPLWGAGVLVVALAAAGGLAARRRWRQSGVALLVGVLSFLALPMLSVWAQVADRALGQARAAVGLSESVAGGVPNRLLESPMHSSYGLAFVVLLVAAGALAVVDVVHRKLSASALVALGGVPLTLLVVALTLAYDPQHMRYIVFPVALSSAVFGVALRVRVLAWATVAVSAATLLVLLGYFVPRPAGVAFLPENRESDRTARWFVQGGEGRGKGDPDAFRYLELEVPADATLALAVLRDTYLYPAWDARLRRTVLFVDEAGTIPDQAEWLVIGPRKTVDTAGWRLQLATERGWRILRR
jgi:hypothetical protein